MSTRTFLGTSLEEYTKELATKSPTPGGGGTAALVSVLGVALGEMVGNLTVGKEKYKEYESDIKELLARSKVIQSELLTLIDMDAKVFLPLLNAYSLPQDTDEQHAEKEKTIQSALKDAVSVPVAIMHLCAKAIEIMVEFSEKGSRMALSDAGCGATLLRAGLESAWLNVKINTSQITDLNFKKETESTCKEILRDYVPLAGQVYGYVEAVV
ncbi:MAG: cyclodeaminase/cyclohydrolase family protein [Clostridiales Family XIII bacterium]|jgi:formiminotetrahydrofolate cyclodeaminase|nr:cyclodeaminase/cyclohydrolase family protein [Clostridiales Family XIII bacterium]